MPKKRRSNDWGFPRWRSYDSVDEPKKVKLCDHVGCDKPGAHPAPKSTHGKERWWFCMEHAAAFNKNWNYFEGLNAEETATREAEEKRQSKAWKSSGFWDWGTRGDDASPGIDREKRQALELFGLEYDASVEEIKSCYRKLAKRYHPDANRDDPEATHRFHKLQAAYQILVSSSKSYSP